MAAAVLVLCGDAMPAAAAPADCIATYDRQGRVTGRYCGDGAGAGQTEAPPPGTRRLSSGKGPGRAWGRAPRPSAPGVDIRCDGPGKRCRGSFDLR
jgi:hypothetical protein